MCFTEILLHCKFCIFFPKIRCNHSITMHIHSWWKNGCPGNFSSKHWYFNYLSLTNIHLPFNSFSFISSVAFSFNTYICINSYYIKYIPSYIDKMFKNRIVFCWNPDNCELSTFSHCFGLSWLKTKEFCNYLHKILHSCR